jgi:exonuclease III
MKMLSWNIRGLNARSKQGLLWERIMKEQPDILLLQETKCAGEEASQILKKCWKQANLVEVDAKGAAGGLVVLWNPATVLMEGFLHLQLDHHNLLLSHRFEQARLYHECLRPCNPRRQGSLPPSFGMDF